MEFYKGEELVFTRVNKALDHFSATTSLETNLQKSGMFITRVTNQVKLNLLAKTRFIFGEFLIIYLGLPLKSKNYRVCQ